jgi:hypothetical protein
MAAVGGAFGTLVEMLGNGGIGIVAGAVVLAIVALGKKLFTRPAVAA